MRHIFLALVLAGGCTATADPYQTRHLTSELRYNIVHERTPYGNPMPQWLQNISQRLRGKWREPKEVGLNPGLLASLSFWAILRHTVGLVPTEFDRRFGTPEATALSIKEAVIDYLDPHHLVFLEGEVQEFLGADHNVFNKFKAGDWGPLFEIAGVHRAAIERYEAFAFDLEDEEQLKLATAVLQRHAGRLGDVGLPQARALDVGGLRIRMVYDLSLRIGGALAEESDPQKLVRAAIAQQHHDVSQRATAFANSRVAMLTVFRAIIESLDSRSTVLRNSPPRDGPPPVLEHELTTGYGHVLDFIDMNEITEASAGQFREAINLLKGSGGAGMVLDLRGSQRGSFHAAMEIAATLIGEKVIFGVAHMGAAIVGEGTRPRFETWYSEPKERITYSGPVVVLMDNRTSGVAELLIAVLQDYNRAIVIGTPRTAGKGVAESHYPMDEFAFYDNVDRRVVRIREADAGVVSLSSAILMNARGTTAHGFGVPSDISILEPWPAPPPTRVAHNPKLLGVTGNTHPNMEARQWLSGDERVYLAEQMKKRMNLSEPLEPTLEPEIRRAAFEALDEMINTVGSSFRRPELPQSRLSRACDRLLSRYRDIGQNL